MGVKGLWKLLEPCGRRIHVETLENTTLAVDVSIWMTQFVKAMRDEEGRPIKNAHVIGTLRRVAKLLYHGVRPVIVFDGGVPALKGGSSASGACAASAARTTRAPPRSGSSPARLRAVRRSAGKPRPKIRRRPTRAASTREPGRGRTYKGAGAAPRAHAKSPEVVVGRRRRRRLRVGARRDRGRARRRGRRRRFCRGRRGAHRPAAVRRARVEAVNRKQRVAARRRCPWPGTRTSSRRRSSLRSCGARRSGSASSGPRPSGATTTRAASASTPIPSGASCCCATMKTVSRSGAASRRAWSGS